jgi:hypothetical protein
MTETAPETQAPSAIPQAELDALTDRLVEQLKTVFDPEIPVEDPGPVDDPVHGHVPRPLDQYEPRRWLLGNILIRQFVTVLAGSGGGGKTSLAIGWALSLASGKPVMGERVGKPRRVLIWSEDPPEELAKRVDAAMQIHGLTRADLINASIPGQIQPGAPAAKPNDEGVTP